MMTRLKIESETGSYQFLVDGKEVREGKAGDVRLFVVATTDGSDPVDEVRRMFQEKVGRMTQEKTQRPGRPGGTMKKKNLL